MVVNQAHLGCNKTVSLSLGSSYSTSPLSGFKELLHIEGSCAIHGQQIVHEFTYYILTFGSKDYSGSQQGFYFPMLCKGTQVIQWWLRQFHSLKWDLLASPTLHVTAQKCVELLVHLLLYLHEQIIVSNRLCCALFLNNVIQFPWTYTPVHTGWRQSFFDRYKFVFFVMVLMSYSGYRWMNYCIIMLLKKNKALIKL